MLVDSPRGVNQEFWRLKYHYFEAFGFPGLVNAVFHLILSFPIPLSKKKTNSSISVISSRRSDSVFWFYLCEPPYVSASFPGLFPFKFGGESSGTRLQKFNRQVAFIFAD